jgi:hypothetical protein
MANADGFATEKNGATEPAKEEKNSTRNEGTELKMWVLSAMDHNVNDRGE